MTATKGLKVTTDSGEFTVLEAPDGGVAVLRRGDLWLMPDPAHSLTMLAMARDLDAARRRVSTYSDVGEFHVKFDLPHFGDGRPPNLLDHDTFEFRLGFLREELSELVSAHESRDMPSFADALCDIIYVALGTGHLARLPLDSCFAEVHRANMTKERAAGSADPRSKRSHSLDVVKPAGFVPPDHGPSIERARAGAGKLAP